MMKLRSQKGMTIVELLINSVIALVVIGVINVVILLALQQRSFRLASSMRTDLEMKTMQFLVNDNIWEATVDNNASMDCLKDPIKHPTVANAGDCPATANGTFDFYNERGELLASASDPDKGFSNSGKPCSGFPADGDQSDNCPFQVSASWRLVSPTQVAVDFNSTYRGKIANLYGPAPVRTFLRNIGGGTCTNDLILFMAFDDPVGTPIGTVANAVNDGSTYNYDGTGFDMGGPNFNYVPGRFGSGASLLGNNRIEIPDQPCLNPTDEISISVWVNIQAANGPPGYNTILDKRYVGNADSYVIRFFWDGSLPAPNNARLEFCVEPGVMTCTSGAVQVVTGGGTWHHIAATYDGNRMRTYFEGVLNDDRPFVGAIPVSTDPLIIGIENQPTLCGGLCGPVNGSIDQLRIYNRALSAAEITNLSVNP